MTPEILAEGNRLQGVLDVLSSNKSFLNFHTPGKSAVEILAILRNAFESLANVNHEQTASAMQAIVQEFVSNSIGAIDAALDSVQTEFNNLGSNQAQ